MRWWHFALALVASLSIHGMVDVAMQSNDEPILEAGVSNAAIVFVSDVQFDALAEGEEVEEVVEETAAPAVQQNPQPVQSTRVAAVAMANTARPVESISPVNPTPTAPSPVQARTIAIPQSETASPLLAASEVDNETAPADLAEQITQTEAQRPDAVEVARLQPDDASNLQEPEKPSEVTAKPAEEMSPPPETRKVEAETTGRQQERADTEAVEPTALEKPVEQKTSVEQEQKQTAEQPEQKSPDEAVKSLQSKIVQQHNSVKPVEVASVDPVERAAPEVLQPERSKTHENVTEIPVPKEMPEEIKQRRQEIAAAAAARPDPPKKVTKPTRKKSGKSGQNSANARKGQNVTGEDRAGKNLGPSGNAAIANYAGKVRRKILRSVRMPRNLSRRSVVTVRFSVTSSGGLASVRVVRGSGSSEIDARALDTVRRAAPFPKFPRGTNRNSWQFTVPLEFRPR
nr:TonB family protein [Flavimaribacter sediminis]